MTTPEADSMADLIADCADIPARLRTPRPAGAPSTPGAEAGWTVSDACVDQVRDY